MTDDILPAPVVAVKRKTKDYRKLVVAIWGAVLTILSRHGVDITDLVILSTALGVGYVPNGTVVRSRG